MSTHWMAVTLSSLVFAVGVGYGTSARAGDYDATSRVCSGTGADSAAESSERAFANCTGIEPASPMAVSHAESWSELVGECSECVGDNANELQISAWCYDADRGLLQVDSEWAHAESVSLTCPDDHAELWYHTVRTRF